MEESRTSINISFDTSSYWSAVGPKCSERVFKKMIKRKCFQGWPFGIGDNYFSLSQHSSVACSSLSSTGGLVNSSMFACLLVLSWFRSCQAAMLLRLHGCDISGISRKLLAPPALSFFPPHLPLWSLSLRRRCAIDLLVGAQLHNSAFWSAVGFL